MTTKVLEAMKAAEIAQSDLGVAAKLALVKGPKEQGEKILLDVEVLPPDLQSQVRKFYHELNSALGDFGKAGLKVGKVLKDARELLKPLGIWIAFLNRVPGLSAKTGDRFIKRFEMAQKQLSETLLSLAITTGINLAGETEREPYGRYTRAVKKVGTPPKESGDKEKDMERARDWLAEVLTVYGKQVRRAREKAAEVDPIDKAAFTLTKAARGYVEDVEGQVSFLQRVVAQAMKNLGVPKEVRGVGDGRRKKPVGSAA